VLPRSPTDVPSLSGQRTCTMHPEHCCKLQAEAIRGCESRLDRSDYHGDARTCHRRRRSRRKPAAASGTRPSRMHCIMNMPLAGSPAAANRPAEAARCFEVACEPPDARLPSAICQMWRERPAHTAGPYQYATNSGFRLDGHDLLAPCASLPPHRWTSRCRMRGVGATCTAPTTHGHHKRMEGPECCQLGAA
jgi:hypothetical protein